MGRATWTNWVGNQTCHPVAVLRPRDEGEVVAAVSDAIAAGRNVRVAATGHSFTPVCLTDGVVLELADLAGVLGADPERRRATALAGTSVGAFGEPLWETGLALANHFPPLLRIEVRQLFEQGDGRRLLRTAMIPPWRRLTQTTLRT